MGFSFSNSKENRSPGPFRGELGKLNLPSADIPACVLKETSSKHATQDRHNLENKQHRCQLKSRDYTAIRELREQ